MHGMNVVIVIDTEYKKNCSFSTADSIKLATVVGCDAEDNFALAFTVCGCAAIPRFLSDCSPCSLIPNC